MGLVSSSVVHWNFSHKTDLWNKIFTYWTVTASLLRFIHFSNPSMVLCTWAEHALKQSALKWNCSLRRTGFTPVFCKMDYAVLKPSGKVGLLKRTASTLLCFFSDYKWEAGHAIGRFRLEYHDSDGTTQICNFCLLLLFIHCIHNII